MHHFEILKDETCPFGSGLEVCNWLLVVFFFQNCRKITSVGWIKYLGKFDLIEYILQIFCNTLIKYLESFDTKFFMAGLTETLSRKCSINMVLQGTRNGILLP